MSRFTLLHSMMRQLLHIIFLRDRPLSSIAQQLRPIEIFPATDCATIEGEKEKEEVMII